MLLDTWCEAVLRDVMVFETRTRGGPTLAILAMLCLAIPMWRATSGMPVGREFHHELTSPVLALNFSKGAGEARPVLEPKTTPPIDPKPKLRKNLEFDFAFLFGYTGFIVLLSRTLGRPRLMPLVAALAVLTGIADGLENWASLRVIGSYPGFANVAVWPFPFAEAKWGLLGAALVAAGFPTRRIGGEASGSQPDGLAGDSQFSGRGVRVAVGWVVAGLLDYGHSALTVVLFGLLARVYLVAAVGGRWVPVRVPERKPLSSRA